MLIKFKKNVNKTFNVICDLIFNLMPDRVVIDKITFITATRNTRITVKLVVGIDNK